MEAKTLVTINLYFIEKTAFSKFVLMYRTKDVRNIEHSRLRHFRHCHFVE